MKKIGFVVPWYHKDIRGGAEQGIKRNCDPLESQ